MMALRLGDTYIELVLSDPETSHIYIPTKGLIDTSNFVTQKIENPNSSVALIFNESTGGGAKFTHQDGTESYVGVSDGGENGMVAQIYADKNVNGNWIGSRSECGTARVCSTTTQRTRLLMVMWRTTRSMKSQPKAMCPLWQISLCGRKCKLCPGGKPGRKLHLK